jgi:hypothetical protein
MVFTQNDGTWLMNVDDGGATAFSAYVEYAGLAVWRPTR